MKKILIPIIAIAAFVSCNKEWTGHTPNGGLKTVEISIENSAAVTKAVTSWAGENSAVCSVSDLTALFADKSGNIVDSKTFPKGTVGGLYTFANVPATVSKVAAIALRGNEVPETLAAAEQLALNTEYVDAAYDELVVYGQDLAPVVTNGVLKASFTVAPMQARIEVASISTTDYFTNTLDAPAKYSAYNLKSLSLAGYADYAADLTAYPLNQQKRTAAPGGGQVWSWNIKQQPVKNMVLSLDLVGYDYTIAVPNRTITINSYKVNGEPVGSFEAGNIYRFDISFSEQNFDENTTSEVGVGVELTIAKWVINTTEIGFANSAPATEPEI